jgi:hypothetical protein
MISGILIISILSIILYIRSLKINILDLNSENIRLNAELSTLINVNKENDKTINILKKDIEIRDISIVRLNNNIGAIKNKTDKLEKYISNISASENGPLAPVLKNTIQMIQDEQHNEN